MRLTKPLNGKAEEMTPAELIRDDGIEALESLESRLHKYWEDAERDIIKEQKILKAAEKEEYKDVRASVVSKSEERIKHYQHNKSILVSLLEETRNELQRILHRCPRCGEKDVQDVCQREFVGTGGDYNGMASVLVGYKCEDCGWGEEL